MFQQFTPVEAELVNERGHIKCDSGEIIELDKYTNADARFDIIERCRNLKAPFCSDKSDVTPKTCSWACLHYTSIMKGTRGKKPWPCPGEAKCIGRHQICDGIPDCKNGQDEYVELCTDDFCTNGFVSYDGNQFNYSTQKYDYDTTDIGTDYIFREYRYPNMKSKNMEDYKNRYTTSNGKVINASLQNLAMPKCRHSTKCLRRNSYDNDWQDWIEC